MLPTSAGTGNLDRSFTSGGEVSHLAQDDLLIEGKIQLDQAWGGAQLCRFSLTNNQKAVVLSLNMKDCQF